MWLLHLYIAVGIICLISIVTINLLFGKKIDKKAQSLHLLKEAQERTKGKMTDFLICFIPVARIMVVLVLLILALTPLETIKDWIDQIETGAGQTHD